MKINCLTSQPGETGRVGIEVMYEINFRLEAIELSVKDGAEETERRAAASEKTLVDTLDNLKEEMREKFGAVTSKVDNLNENLKVSEDGGADKFNKVEANFNALQTALRDIQSDNSRKIERVVEETRNSKDLLTWMESKIKESKVEYTGKVGGSYVDGLLHSNCETLSDP